ncbi:MAG: thioredoxin family protein [Flavobacteriaceae bacterium]
MRHFFIFLLLCSSIACNQQSEKKTTVSLPQTEVDIPTALLGKDWEGNEILVGKITYAQMAYYTKDWFAPDYERYRVNAQQLAEITPLLKNKKVVLIMGTWCEDSQREVPGMMRILAEANYPVNTMEIIAVDEDKTTKDGIEKNHGLAYVPALIFYEGEKEINRIVEFPINTLEQDILDIISGKEYKNAYAE